MLAKLRTVPRRCVSLTSFEPDVVLLDLAMPGTSGLDALRLIKRDGSSTRALILSQYDDESYLRRALEGGASGYVLKRAADVELLPQSEQCHVERFILSPC